MKFAMALMFAFPLVGCALSDNPAVTEKSYRVIYSVATTGASPTSIVYTDRAGIDQTITPTLPWSLTFSVEYDFDTPVTPTLEATGVNLGAGEELTLRISWQDYKTGFATEELAERVEPYSGATLDVKIFGAPLPKL
jgi:hypothetical protein